jgi:NADPH:quinone reductase-like Zn-dependent oxidoreductase
MRALILGGYATRPATLLCQMPDADPKAHEVRVRIEAAALNPLDSKIAIGAMKDWL